MTINSWFETAPAEIFGEYNISSLNRDECFVQMEEEGWYMYRKLHDCVGCPFENYFQSLYDIRRSAVYRVYNDSFRQFISPDDKEGFVCEVDNPFDEFGVYTVLDLHNEICRVQAESEGVNMYFPILTVFLIYFVAYFLIFFINIAYKRFLKKIEANEVADEKEKKRLKSLDTFRGLSIVLMIFVNYGAGAYAIFEHAVWNGLHLADLPFPWFLWIMGVCIPMSVKSSIKRESNKLKIIQKITKRSCILFLLGLFLNGGSYFSKLRIFAVLQRFGICYFIVACTCVLLYKEESEEQKKFVPVDIWNLKFHYIVVFACIILHLCLTFLLPVEGCPTGYLGPGGFHNLRKHVNCTGGAAGYIDREVIGINHMYEAYEVKEVYHSISFDPEGILSSFNAIVQVFLGVQAGMILQSYKSHKARLLWWTIWGVSLGAIGALLCQCTKDDGWVPVNKNLWSISYTLVTSCFAFLLLAIFYFIIDMQKLWTGKPLLFAGMNSIIMYVGHSMVYSNFPIRWKTDDFSRTHFIVLLENVWATSLWVFVAYLLYRKKFFLSI